MRKHDQGSAAAEGARRATGAAAEPDRTGRFSARRKRETVLRLLRGEDLGREKLYRPLGGLRPGAGGGVGCGIRLIVR